MGHCSGSPATIAAASRLRAHGYSPTIVVTQHAPNPQCIRPWLEGSRLNPGFASGLDSVMARYQPRLWVHGHMNDRVDEKHGETRVVCNPGGAAGSRGHEFDLAFVVEA